MAVGPLKGEPLALESRLSKTDVIILCWPHNDSSAPSLVFDTVATLGTLHWRGHTHVTNAYELCVFTVPARACVFCCAALRKSAALHLRVAQSDTDGGGEGNGWMVGRRHDMQNENLSTLMRWCEGKGTTRMPYEEFMNKFDGANRMEPEGWTTKPEHHKTTKSTRFKPLYARTPRNAAPLDYTTRHSDPSPMSTLREEHQCVYTLCPPVARTRTYTHALRLHLRLPLPLSS